jgi:hypothetical protein
VSGARTIRRLLLAVTVLVVVASGCGIPTDDNPRDIPEQALPPPVRDPRGTSSTTSSTRPSSAQQVQLYLVREAGASQAADQLEPVTAPIAAPTNQAELPRLVIEELIRARPEDFGLAGIAVNAVPSDTRVLNATVTDGVLDLDLTLLGIDNPRLRLAVAQMVFTACDGITSMDINAVRFSFDGELASVPTEAGSVQPGTPVFPSDYPQLAQPSESTGGDVGSG